MKDLLITVDLLDNPVGMATKQDIHAGRILHRAFSVFLVDGDKMLLHRRALGKYHSGGLWTNACCSHQRVHDTLEESVTRRLGEELGVNCPVREIGSFVYFADFGQVCEYEYDHVFLGTYRGSVNPDPEEIAELKWMPIADIQADITAAPEKYTQWFITAFPMVCRCLRDSG